MQYSTRHDPVFKSDVQCFNWTIPHVLPRVFCETDSVSLRAIRVKLHHFYKLDNVCTLTQVGEYRKIPAFGLGSSLGLRPWELPRPHAGILLHSPPLVKVQTQYSEVLGSTMQYCTVQFRTVHCAVMCGVACGWKVLMNRCECNWQPHTKRLQKVEIPNKWLFPKRRRFSRTKLNININILSLSQCEPKRESFRAVRAFLGLDMSKNNTMIFFF